MRRLVTVLLFILTALYPVMVYLWLGELSPRAIGGALLLLLLVRVVMAKSAATAGLRGILPVMCLFALILMWFNNQQMVLWYPVLVSALMLLVFSYTLKVPPTMIERLARIREPDFPDSAVQYARKVTIAWCVFFAANGLLAAITAIWASLAVWTLYNGLIAYVLMGLMFAIELIVRQRVRGKHAH